MSDFTQDQIFSLICEHCDVAYLGDDQTKRDPQNFDLSPEDYRKLSSQIARMHGAAHVWTRPSKIESEIEDARKKISSAIAAIKGLDGHAKSLARIEADRGREERLLAQLEESARLGGTKGEQSVRAKEICAAYQPQPIAEWVDHAAIAAMEKLRDALIYPVEQAIPNAPTGPGRPPNRRAYLVAEHAYLIFKDLTGRKPTFWNAKETTPFGRMVELLFRVYGIKSTVRKPIEAAMHKFSPDE
ncbi:hypothetical protein [Roseovarius spongiae]|uniref:hypothetical protein n=1 Tax=Roseovarius spongiae TaxID=2320272 RepID=UPI0011C4712A|nr:hypothetical protein [Roseovarius spongiae]